MMTTHDSRIDHILTQLASAHASHLLAEPKNASNRQETLANGLAQNGVLVILGDIPQKPNLNRDAMINRWVSAYGSLYALLIETLFPSYARIKATYADIELPPVVVFEAETQPVIQTLAGYVVPYVALRQKERFISEAELRGVMHLVLDELEAHDLSKDDYNRLLVGGARIMHDLLQMHVQCIALTPFAQPMFQRVQPLVTQTGQDTPPPDLPLADQQPKRATPDATAARVPIFFDRDLLGNLLERGNAAPNAPDASNQRHSSFNFKQER